MACLDYWLWDTHTRVCVFFSCTIQGEAGLTIPGNIMTTRNATLDAYLSRIKNITKFEIESVYINPFYLQEAFNFHMNDCVDIINKYHISVSIEAHAYAILSHELRHSTDQRVSVEDIRNVFEQNMVSDYLFRGNTLKLFPEDHLENHVFSNVNVDIVPPCELGNGQLHGPRLINAIREKRFMENRIVFRDGVYSWYQPEDELIDELEKMITSFKG